MIRKKTWLEDCLTPEVIQEIIECSEKIDKAEEKVRLCPVFNKKIKCHGICECCEAEDFMEFGE